VPSDRSKPQSRRRWRNRRSKLKWVWWRHSTTMQNLKWDSERISPSFLPAEVEMARRT